MKSLLFIICFILVSANLLFAQDTKDYPNLEANRELDSRRKVLDSVVKVSENQRAVIQRRKKFYEGKLNKEQKKLLTPSEENLLKYEQFLKTPETGIVKILSDPKCEVNVLDVNNLKCVNALPIYGNGAFYSFSKKTHAEFNTAEIFLTDDIFRVGFLGNFLSLIVDLGDRDINSISGTTEESRVLSSIAPVRVFSKFPSQKRIMGKGIFFNGRNYKTEAPVKLNHTYIMRSIKYHSIKYFMIEYYYNDVTVIFRVVDKDSEGNVTLVWKKLAQKKNVHLKSKL